jgi:hypothetical protein
MTDKVITFFILPYGVMQVTQKGNGDLIAIDLIQEQHE